MDIQGALDALSKSTALLASAFWTNIDPLLKLVALVGGALWALYKLKEFREFKHRIQFDVDAHLYKLGSGLTPPKARYTWTRPHTNEDGTPVPAEPRIISSKGAPCTHAVEVQFRFANCGKTRFRLYNLQLTVATIEPGTPPRIDEEDGHLELMTLFRSGNIVPSPPVLERKSLFGRPRHLLGRLREQKPKGRPFFYYIEPGIQQTIGYLALIPTPSELLRVVGAFSLEQDRIFPAEWLGKKRLYPHTAVKTYQVSPDGLIVGQR